MHRVNRDSLAATSIDYVKLRIHRSIRGTDTIWFNLELDSLYITNQYHNFWLQDLEPGNVGRVKNVTIHEAHIKYPKKNKKNTEAFAKLERLDVVVGTTRNTTRTKVLVKTELQDAVNGVRSQAPNGLMSGEWGRNAGLGKTMRVRRLLTLMKNIQKLVAETEEKKMPVLRVMVLCKKDLARSGEE